MHLCPTCGHDRARDLTRERVALHALGIVAEQMDPGGRLLILADGTHVRLSDQCNSCDAVVIRQVLAAKAAQC